MLRQTLFTVVLLVSTQMAHAVSVAFFNPGRSDEAFWLAASQGMQEAAKSLNMQLEILYAERDHTKALTQMQALVARPRTQRPDYLIITNDYGIGPAMLNIIARTGIPTFLAYSGIHGEERVATGAPRTKFPFWLGSLEPRSADAGHLTAKALIEAGRKNQNLLAPDGKLHMIAIAGDRSTPASIARTQGMLEEVKKSPNIVLLQVVYADWKRDKAGEQANWLFARYPQTRLIWSGSDQIAFGAMEAWKNRGGSPGVDALFSGVNTSEEALAARQSGKLSALAGGHFMCGAWAMVLVHDHAKGRDFSSEGLELNFPMFILFDAPRIDSFKAMMSNGIPRTQFRAYSKVLNPNLKKYDFNLNHLLR